PAYPYTNRNSAKVDINDVINQPADASFALTSTLALDTQDGDPLRGHLDTNRVAAAGHSAGGVTTVGLFSAYRDTRLRAGIVLAGNAIGVGAAFTGPTAPLLFVHGDRDALVPFSTGLNAYDRVSWPKCFVTLSGEGHVDPYLRADYPAFGYVRQATIEFL